MPNKRVNVQYFGGRLRLMVPKDGSVEDVRTAVRTLRHCVEIEVYNLSYRAGAALPLLRAQVHAKIKSKVSSLQ